MTFALERLWSDRLEGLMGAMAAGQRDHEEIARLAQHIGADYHGRFLVELLQNASDPSRSAGATAASVTVVRTRELVAIANQGLPFDQVGIEAVTSLGLSPKDPRFAIGNKGVGFKSVFQVSAAPEIFSAASPEGRFDDENGIRLCLDQAPLDDPAMRTHLASIVARLLQSYPEIKARLEARTGAHDLVAEVLKAVQRAAPFKFPRPVSKEQLSARVSALHLSKALHAQTLIVLPLLEGPETQRVVDQAVSELCDTTGGTILFLPAVARIEVVDHVSDVTHEITRTPLQDVIPLPRRSRLQRVRTLITTVAANQLTDAPREWWIVERTLGEDAEANRAHAEQEELARAVATLPGENWKPVRTGAVAVALPVPAESGLPLAADGLFCIALPTRSATGTPFWIDARFHGTLSRTGIDLRDTAYNRVLFLEALRLAQDLLDHLRASPLLSERRAVTLAMATRNGPMAEALLAPDGIARGPVVLGRDGCRFFHGPELSLPAPVDGSMFGVVQAAVSDIETYGFVLADGALLRGARPILDALGQRGPSAGADRRFLERPGGRPSLLEAAAASNRAAGPAFWEPFLTWVLDRFKPEALLDQRILPVGDRVLASAAERVFFRPLLSGSLADEDTGAIPEELAGQLRFVDETALRVREGGGRDLTPLARLLAPAAGTGLVRSPRLEAVLQDAIAPRLQAAGEDPALRKLALGLLALAADMLGALDERRRAGVRLELLRVPVAGNTGNWTWCAPTDVYLGAGWVEAHEDALLARAYGAGRRLVAWADFEREATSQSRDRSAWREAMLRFGVRAAPRILAAGRRIAPLRARQYELARNEGAVCPFPGLGAYWNDYIGSMVGQTCDRARSAEYDVRSMEWVEGLERADARAAVVELMLRHADEYIPRCRTSLERVDGEVEAFEVPSLWLYTLRRHTWAVMPTNRGAVAVDQAWLLEASQRVQATDRYSHLAVVPSEFDPARRLLVEMGACTIAEASPSRLARELRRLGDALPALAPERERSASTLVLELWTQLARGIPAPADVAVLLGGPLPLLRERRLVAAVLQSVAPLFVDDDPVRRSLVKGAASAHFVPLRSGVSFQHLSSALRDASGGRVELLATSVAELDTGFAATPGPAVFLLDEIAAEHDEAVVRDLALLLAFGGRAQSDVRGDPFRRAWDRFASARLRRGSFARRPAGGYVFDERAAGGPALQVETTLTSLQVLEATWTLAGAAYRDLWAAYTRSLEQNDRERFFHERNIGPAEWDEVESAIGIRPTHRLVAHRPLCLAIWREANPLASVERFHEGWSSHARDIDTMARWLGSPALPAWFESIRGQSEDLAVTEAIVASLVDADTWQVARAELGLGPGRFPASERAWRDAREMLAAGLLSAAAHLPACDFATAAPLIQGLRSLPVPEALALRPPDERAAIGALLAQGASLAQEAGEVVLAGQISDLAGEPTTALKDICPKAATEREVRLLRDFADNIPHRSALARDAALPVVRVATALAGHYGESVEADALLHTPRVAALVEGLFANCFGVLGALHDTIETTAPQTAKAMSAQRAFHEPRALGALWSQFPVLGPMPGAGAPPPRQITVLGQEHDEAKVMAEIARGTDGAIGQKLSGHAQCALDLCGLRGVARGAAPPFEARRGARGRSQGGDAAQSQRDRDLIGLLGEAFVYESFRLALPGFDATAWVSRNRKLYGLGEAGADTFGCDFRYRDDHGLLTGSARRPMCSIEVKASTDDGSSAFSISSDEWNLAEECHASNGDEVYVVVRVRRARSAPEIFDVIIDPVAHRDAGTLLFAPQDFWVRVGAAITAPAPERQ